MTNGRWLWLGAVLLVGLSRALGQATWNVSSGNWTNAGNWLGGVVPSNTNTLINNGGLATLTNAAPTLGAGDLYVGSNAFGCRLVLTNGGVLSNDVSVIGFAAGSSNNVVSVSGAGSVWRSTGGVFVGRDGFANQLVISAGGVVTNGILRIVGALGSNNTVSVIATGSVWSGTTDVTVGQFGSGNRLIISNGGVVRGAAGNAGFLGAAGSSTSNVVSVTGTGSVWQTANLDVGFSGSENQLEIGVGGLVTNSGGGTLGFNSGSVNNRVIVSGAGARWRSAGSQVVGNSGTGNQLIVTNGGLSASGADGYLGIETGATNNLVVVAGTGSVWNLFGTLIVGSKGFPCRMLVSQGGTVSNRLDAYIGHQPFVGFVSMSNTVLVTGTGSVWRIQRDLVVSDMGTGNELRIESGGIVSNGGGALIGNVASVTNLSAVVTTSSNNFVTVDGPGSRWDLKGNLTVGNFASGNLLLVTNGAAVAAGSNLVLGATLTSSNNQVVVADGTSALTVGGTYAIHRGTHVQRNGAVTTGNLVVTNGTGAYLMQGGSLTITNTGLISQGGLLTARGVVNGNLTIGAGGLLTLAGQPTACVQTGIMTWQGGGTFRWTINHATGAAGVGHDTIPITGSLALSATPSNRFLIQVVGLDPTNAVGAVAGFDNSVPYSWPVVTATAGFAGFDTNAVLLDTSSFTTNNGVIGSFSLVPSGNSLNLVYTPLLSFSTDTDGDGLSDAAESQWVNLGFDWQLSQPTLVSNFLANASRGGLYTPAQVQALNVGTPLISRNATNGTFTLTIGVERSSNLTQFAPFPMSATQTVINAQGRLEFQFALPDDTAFFRLQSQ